MQQRVTAILVAQSRAGTPERALQALEAQSRRPDSLVLVGGSVAEDAAKRIASTASTVAVRRGASFGAAIAQAVRDTPSTGDGEWLWLLSAETAPEPAALAQLLAAVEVAPSVAIAGPKLMRWDEPAVIAAFGESLTRYGRSVQLVHDELDQAQHDRTEDLLAVGAPGMLVRRSLWDALGGFDPALTTVDAALDLCVRARLSGHRVLAVPGARVAADLAAPGFRARRAAQLHRRLVYSPPAALPLHWLSLLPLAIARSLWQIIAKRPWAVGAELAAAIGAAFDTGVGPARRRLARERTLGWGAIAPLRVQPSLARELAADRAGESSLSELAEAEPPRPGFFTTGGAWVVLLLAVVGVTVFSPFLDAATLGGGGLAPLAAMGDLWSNPPTADPFSWMLAVLGTVTFWSPSTSIIALYFAAIPLAGLAAWAAAARFSARGWAPAAAAVVWALAPPFLASLDGGRLGAVIAHILLPWLLLATVNAARSWSAAGAAALLFAAITASAPILWPVLLVGLVAWAATHPRSLYRTLAIPLPAVVLFAPLVIAQLARGTAVGLLAEPGVPVAGGSTSGWQLALGSPRGGFDGWTAVATAFGLPASTGVVAAAALLAPLAALALLAIFLPGSRRAVPLLGVALLGFATAVASGHLAVTHVGASSATVWPGAGLSVYWLGLAGAAVVALESLGRSAALPALLAALGAVAVALPLLAAPLAGLSTVHDSDGRTLPAFVTAEAAARPTVGTLELTARGDGSFVAVVRRGAGTTLDEHSTFDATAGAIDDDDAEVAELAGNLATRSGFDSAPALDKLGVSFVLLPAVEEGAAARARTRAADALDSSDLFVAVGATDNGYLWRYTGEVTDVPGEKPSSLVNASLGIAFGIAALLAIPTGTRRRAVAPGSVDDNPADTFEEDENA